MTEKQDIIDHARRLFKKEMDLLPYNTLTSYVKVQLRDSELWVPCTSRDTEVMERTKDKLTKLASLAGI